MKIGNFINFFCILFVVTMATVLDVVIWLSCSFVLEYIGAAILTLPVVYVWYIVIDYMRKN